MSEYIIKSKGIEANTETTSAISTIAYEIENAKFHHLANRQINQQLVELQKDNKFPPYLEYIDATYDEATSFSAVAFRDTRTGKVTVGFAGTNGDNGPAEDAKDKQQWGDIALVGSSQNAPYFQTARTFIEALQASGYDLATFTGHSLGGRNAAIMGMTYQIPSILVYNSAPVRNGLGQAVSLGVQNTLSPEQMFQHATQTVKTKQEIDQLIEQYHGRLLFFASEKDPLTGAARAAGSLYPGELFIFQNGKGHEMVGFLDKEAQAFILCKGRLVDEQGQIRSSVEVAEAFSKERLSTLDTLRNDWLTKGNGQLSSAQEIFLDAATAKTMTESMLLAMQDKLLEITQYHRNGIQAAKDRWKKVQEEAKDLGATLSKAEELEALALGDATKQTIETDLVTAHEERLATLRTYEVNYLTLLDKINAAIEKQVAVDQELAAYLN